MREFYIAGVQHHKSDEVIDELKKGTVLKMVPEPDNRFDANAIALKFARLKDDCMIGYVPAKFAAEVGAALIIDEGLTCTITELDPSAKPWERIKVIIKENK